jgi:hypothetical protein
LFKRWLDEVQPRGVRSKEWHLDLWSCRQGQPCLFAGVDGQIVFGEKPAIGAVLLDQLLDQPDGTAAVPLLGDLDAGLYRGRFEGGTDPPRGSWRP